MAGTKAIEATVQVPEKVGVTVAKRINVLGCEYPDALVAGGAMLMAQDNCLGRFSVDDPSIAPKSSVLRPN